MTEVKFVHFAVGVNEKNVEKKIKEYMDNFISHINKFGYGNMKITTVIKYMSVREVEIYSTVESIDEDN